jgi:transposase
VDESIFVYDSVVRHAWVKKGSKPIVLKTGSHKKTFLFGALCSDGRQMFRQAEGINGEEFVRYLKALKRKFKSFLLFLDRAPAHNGKTVEDFLEKNRDCIVPVYFPKGSPEFNPLEECWKQGKNSILGNRIPSSFGQLKKEISKYYRTRRFKLDVTKYLCQ